MYNKNPDFLSHTVATATTQNFRLKWKKEKPQTFPEKNLQFICGNFLKAFPKL